MTDMLGGQRGESGGRVISLTSDNSDVLKPRNEEVPSSSLPFNSNIKLQEASTTVVNLYRIPDSIKEDLLRRLSEAESTLRFLERNGDKKVYADDIAQKQNQLKKLAEETEKACQEQIKAEEKVADNGDGIVFDLEPDYESVNINDLRRKAIGDGGYSVILSAKARGGVDGYRTHNTTDPLRPVVVKVARALRLDRQKGGDAEAVSLDEAKGYLIREAKVLSALRRAQTESRPGTHLHFPDAELRRSPDEMSLIMELMPRENLFVEQCKQGKITGKQIRSCLVQHFEALDVVHKAGYSVNDKKGRDYYYLPEQDRYVMLDWNVTSTADEFDHASKRPRYKNDLIIGLEFFQSLHILPIDFSRKIEELSVRLHQPDDLTTAAEIEEIFRDMTALYND